VRGTRVKPDHARETLLARVNCGWRKNVPKPMAQAGQHVLGATLALTALDSGLTIQPYNGEAVEVTGAAPLTGLKWEAFNVTAGGGSTMGGC
jgi:hypothetical protein